MTDRADGLRERTRRAVRAEIMAAAEQVFLARGYEATTVDDIAAEAEMSSRSVYRYFATKDDLLIGRFVEASEGIVDVLRTRPHDEPSWDSLRASLEPLARHVDTSAHDTAAARRLHRAIFTTPTLLGRYLQHLHGAQLDAYDVLLGRRERTPSTMADAVLTHTVVNAAFACLVAAQQTWQARDDDTTLTDAFDVAMRVARPAETAEHAQTPPRR